MNSILRPANGAACFVLLGCLALTACKPQSNQVGGLVPSAGAPPAGKLEAVAPAPTQSSRPAAAPPAGAPNRPATQAAPAAARLQRPPLAEIMAMAPTELSDQEFEAEMKRPTGRVWVRLSNFRVQDALASHERLFAVDYELVGGQPRRYQGYVAYVLSKHPSDSTAQIIGEAMFVGLARRPKGTIVGDLKLYIPSVMTPHVLLVEGNQLPDKLPDFAVSDAMPPGAAAGTAPPPLLSDRLAGKTEGLDVLLAEPRLVGIQKLGRIPGGEFVVSFQRLQEQDAEFRRHFLIVRAPTGKRIEYDINHRMREQRPYTIGKLGGSWDALDPIGRSPGPLEIFVEAEVGGSTARVLVSNVVTVQ